MGHAAVDSTGQNLSLFQKSHTVSVEYSYLTPAIQAAEAYLRFRGTEAELNATLSRVEADIQSFLDRSRSLSFTLTGELAEVLRDCLSLIADFRDGPLDTEQVSLFLDDARHFHTELLGLCVASTAHRLNALEVANAADKQVGRGELARGLYQNVAAALETETCKETLCRRLESHYDEVAAQLSTFRACLGSSDWTSEVRTGDQLALRGLTLWLKGLEMLQEFVLFGRDALKTSGLQSLLEGNRSFLSAQQLVNC